MTDLPLAEILAQIPAGAEAPFPLAEYERRIANARQAMQAKGFDLLLTTGAENIFYLSGQQTPGYYMFQCLAVPAEGECFLINRALESPNARLQSVLTDIHGYADDADPGVAVAEALKARGWQGKRVAIDQNGWYLTVNLYNSLTAAFGPLLDGSFIVEPLRRVKSPAELAQIEQAARANDAGMAAGLAEMRPGVNENDVAAAILAASVKAGGEFVGMEPFVTSGPRSGVAHTTWKRRTVVPGDVVILETAACYNRYHAALYRTIFVGDVPALAEDMYKVCDEALSAAIEVLRPGNTCADVHAAAQAVIDRHGYTDGFRKRSGYSMGISFAPDWGEGNILSLYRGIDVPLQPGMVFHVPITLRDYAKFTVAVSDTIIVTEGAARPLSKLERVALRV
jgi:Xaa-Pro dipeptidase